MEDLSKKVETITIDVDEKLNELINQCEASIKKEKYSEAHSILKEALSIGGQNPKVIALAKKLISIKDPSLDESLPKELLLKICNEDIGIQEKLEAVEKLEKLSSQPNSVFVNQFNELNGPVLVLEALLNVLKNSQNYKEELIQYLLKNITNLTRNQACLESIIKKLAWIGDLSLPKLQDETVILFSGLFRNMFIEISNLENQDVKNIVKDKLYLLYLNVLFAIGKGYSKNVFKNSILPIIQTFSLYDFPFQFSNHILFKNMMIDNLYSKDEEIRGLTIIILMKAKENKEAFDSISKSLTKKFDDLQSNTSQLQSFIFLKSIFQCIEPLGLELITQESWLLEALDLISFEKEESQIEMVEVLGLACNTTEGRKLVMETSLVYLDKLSKNKDQKMSVLKAQAILVKSKLSIENKTEIDQSTIDDLVTPLIDIIIDKESILSSAAKMTAIESLTFYSIHPKVRAILGNNFLFWAGLTNLGLLEDVHPATLYGISAILSNVLAYRKVLTKEQEQIKKLKKLAKESNQTIDEMQDPNMADDIVKKRNSLIIRAPNILSLLVKLSKTKKQNIYACLANIYLSLATDKLNHGELFKYGTVKALLPIAISESTEVALLATQALAKLAIHTDPKIAFPGELKVEAVRPFLNVCQGGSEVYSSASLLQQFECLLSLTNLSCEYPEVRQRIVSLKGLSAIEMLILSDNSMVQRAATELICNMVTNQEVYELYSTVGAKNKIHTLLALSDTDDDSTIIAASGALAILSNSTQVCINILKLPVTLRIIPLLIATNTRIDKQIRGLEILKNILINFNNNKEAFKGINLFEVFNKLTISGLNALNNNNNPPQVKETANAILKVLDSISQ